MDQQLRLPLTMAERDVIRLARTVINPASTAGCEQRAVLAAYTYVRGLPYARCERANHEHNRLYEPHTLPYITRQIAAQYVVAWRLGLARPTFDKEFTWRCTLNEAAVKAEVAALTAWAQRRDSEPSA